MSTSNCKVPGFLDHRDAQHYVLSIVGPSVDDTHRKVATTVCSDFGTLQWQTSQSPTGKTALSTNVHADGLAMAETWNRLRADISNADIWVRPQHAEPVRLLMCDMDSTIIPTESLDELAAEVGIGQQVADITTRAMAGELDFKQALDERVGLLKGLDVSVIDECVAKTTINPGAAELVSHAKQAGIHTILISGGFGPFVSYVANLLGFDNWFSNTLEIENSALTGQVLPPLVDKNTKLQVLKQEIERLQITPAQACTVGDGANDLGMLGHAGFGIAYRAKPVVLQDTHYHLQHGNLDDLINLLPQLL